MKTPKTILMVASAAILAGAVSCNKTDSPAQTEGTPAELTLNISNGAFTKAAINDANENKVNNVQIFVFRKDGELDAYATSTQKNDIKVSCTTGPKDVYALVNAPDGSKISKKSELEATTSKLSDNSLTNFVMIGSKPIDMTPSVNETIMVSRVAARLTVSKITAAFTSQAYKQMEFKVNRIYVVNAAGDVNYKLDKKAPTTWFNKMAYTTSDVDALLYADATDTKITEATPYDTPTSFYTYPNSTQTDSQAEEFSARFTRVVVETTLGGKTYYYPVSIENIESNRYYNIKNLTITRPGSLSPDTPVSSLECTVSIEVKEWGHGMEKDFTI